MRQTSFMEGRILGSMAQQLLTSFMNRLSLLSGACWALPSASPVQIALHTIRVRTWHYHGKWVYIQGLGFGPGSPLQMGLHTRGTRKDTTKSPPTV